MLGTKNKTEITQKAFQLLQSTLKEDYTGHDHWHGYRVWKTALHIAEKEGIKDEKSILVIELSAILHDVIDFKLNTGWDESRLKSWMDENAGEEISEHVLSVIKNISFKGAGVKDQMSTEEGKIVQDADRLDALGAIGIARVFATGAYFKRPIYDPEVEHTLHADEKAYTSREKGNSINHFHEKLFLLKDRMHTATGKEIAEQRDKYMHEFLDRFLEEWEGKDF